MIPHDLSTMTPVRSGATLNACRVLYGQDVLGTFATLERALEAPGVPEGARIVDSSGRVRARLERRFDQGRTSRAWKLEGLR